MLGPSMQAPEHGVLKCTHRVTDDFSLLSFVSLSRAVDIVADTLVRAGVTVLHRRGSAITALTLSSTEDGKGTALHVDRA